MFTELKTQDEPTKHQPEPVIYRVYAVVYSVILLFFEQKRAFHNFFILQKFNFNENAPMLRHVIPQCVVWHGAAWRNIICSWIWAEPRYAARVTRHEYVIKKRKRKTRAANAKRG